MIKQFSLKTWFGVKELAISLIVTQVIVKFFIEFPEVSKLSTGLPIYQTAWLLTAGWLVLLPLCLQDYRDGFRAGAIWGIVNAVLAVWAPVSGTCNHWFLGFAIGAQCLLIALTCWWVYKRA
jgi:hypothetical protein